MNDRVTLAASPDAGYQETIAMLEEEVARLEGELRLREDVLVEGGRPEIDADGVADRALEARVAELTAELARRDEEAAILWDEIRTIEEAAVAKQAEWEQLNRWISEVEQRVEGRVDEDADLVRDLSAQRRAAETATQSLESERRSWESQRRAFEDEVESLRARLSTRSTNESTDTVTASLQEENQRLRDSVRELAANAALAGETEELRAELRATKDALEHAQQALQGALDDREQARNEHAAELASLRTQFACEAAKARELSGDDRLMAFRQHLREVQDREDEARRSKQLTSRLAQLWRRSGPKR